MRESTEDLITGNSQTEYVPSLNKSTLKPLEAHASFIFHIFIFLLLRVRSSFTQELYLHHQQ